MQLSWQRKKDVFLFAGNILADMLGQFYSLKFVFHAINTREFTFYIVR